MCAIFVYIESIGEYMRIGKIALGLTITSSGLILSIPVHAGYVGNDPLNAVDPSGRVTCSNSDCSKATIDPNPTGQTTFAPPKAPQSTSIPSQQSPINSDTISFINDNPKNPSPINQSPMIRQWQ